MRALLFLLHTAVATLNIAGDAVVSVLWCLNVYGAIMARLLCDSINTNVSGDQPSKVTRNCVQKPYIF